MKKIILLFSAVLLIAIISFFMIEGMSKNSKAGKVCFNGSCFIVEIAKTLDEKKAGLMYRENLNQDKGMLFIYNSEGEYGYWMKNTLIPLDIIWINKDGKVVYISSNTLPCKQADCPVVSPKADAKYVLELNSGIAEKIGIKEGSKLDIDY